MSDRNTGKPWFLRLLSRSQSLLNVAQWVNRKMFYRMGMKVGAADNLTMSRDWPDRLLYFGRLLSSVKSVRGDNKVNVFRWQWDIQEMSLYKGDVREFTVTDLQHSLGRIDAGNIYTGR